MYRGQELLLFDFSGGLASANYSTSTDPRKANLLRNVFIRVGNGLEKRRGNTVFNSSAMASGAALAGLEAVKFSNGNEYFLAVCNTTVQQGLISGSSMTDITGAVVIAGGTNNKWTISTLNDLAIGVGGAPDAPFKWSGAGNAAALAGSPPSGNFGFQHNNRLFIGNTSANPSTIYWSILGNPEDWSSSGSGSQNVWKNDGDTLVGYAILSDDNVLLFKQRSIHRMTGRTSPFPVIPVFRDVGAIGNKSIVVANGLAYFITTRGRLMITDGSAIYNDEQIPNLRDIDDIWDGLNTSRNVYIEGRRYTGLGFDHIIWLVSNTGSSTHNLALVWDIRNKCWLQHTTGHGGNVLTKTQSGTLYMGAYDGKIYKMDVANKYTDDSETSPGAIDGYWRSGWLVSDSIKMTKHPHSLQVVMVSQSAGTLQVGYGFDFVNDKIIENKSMVSTGATWDQFLWDQALWGASTDLMRTVYIKGRGNVFQYSFRNNNANELFQIHGVSISGKKGAQKVLEAA